MNTSLGYCKKILQFVGTSMLIFTAPSNISVLTFALLFGLVKSSRRIHPIMRDFLFSGRRLSSSDRKGE